MDIELEYADGGSELGIISPGVENNEETIKVEGCEKIISTVPAARILLDRQR